MTRLIAKSTMTNKCTSVRPSSTAAAKRWCNAAYIDQWRESRASLEATGCRHRLSICTVSPHWTTGSHSFKNNNNKAPYLPAILLAVAVRRYDTKCITRWRGSMATPEATGCCHWASIAADSINQSRKSQFFPIFFIVDPLKKRTG